MHQDPPLRIEGLRNGPALPIAQSCRLRRAPLSLSVAGSSSFTLTVPLLDYPTSAGRSRPRRNSAAVHRSHVDDAPGHQHHIGNGDANASDPDSSGGMADGQGVPGVGCGGAGAELITVARSFNLSNRVRDGRQTKGIAVREDHPAWTYCRFPVGRTACTSTTRSPAAEPRRARLDCGVPPCCQ
jgi:hypothetical protein